MINSYKLKITKLAFEDMDQIFDYIAYELFNPVAAKDLLYEFEKAFKKICIFPLSFPNICNEYVKDKNLRKLAVKNYMVFYRIKGNEVQITRVLYGMRQYEILL